MKSISRKIMTSLLCGTMALATFTLAGAEEEKPEADLSVGLYSQYVWRGWTLSEDSLVIQPSMTVSYKGFAANLWGNLDTEQYDPTASETNNWNETDLTLSYDWSMFGLDFGAGYIYYALDGGNDSQEVYAALRKDILLAPTLTIYRDYDSFPGWYITAEISHSFLLGESMSLDIGAKASYLLADEETTYADPSDPTDEFSNFFDGVLSVALPISVGQYLTITPEAYCSFALSDDAEDLLEIDNAAFDNDETTFYGGVSASFSF
ncbi:MAG: hypothetical protein ABFS09_10265 [Thermodesulfobacteriota bacterium]